MRRFDLARLSLGLAGLILTLDLLWGMVEGSTGSIAFGLVDEPAHLATCLVALLAVVTLGGIRPLVPFVASALIASVAIDIDHIPGFLGWDWLAGAMPRPYPHSLFTVGALLALGWASRGDARQVSFGLAFGVGAHLIRDLATGPGVPLIWPFSAATVVLPYAFFAVGLALAAVLATASPAHAHKRVGFATALAACVLAVAVLAPTATEAKKFPRVSIGAYIPHADNNNALIDRFGRQVGRSAEIILSYKDWTQAPFVGDQLDGIWNHGAAPMITWEPWTDSGDGISLWSIAAGDHDGYVRSAARAAAAWRRPIMLRFAQEMNGTWFPWGGGNGGNTAAAFKAAWRHLVTVFREEEAHNVKWVWTPYVNIRGRFGFKRFFPGGEWIDWAGLDGINWGGSLEWQSFRELFAPSYNQLKRLTSRPMVLAEVASGERGGRKAGWVAAMMKHELPRMKRIRAVVFWSAVDYRGDFRVDSSSAALRALRSAAKGKRYG